MNTTTRSRLLVALTVVGIASIALTGGAIALDGAATQEQDGQANGTLLEDGFYEEPTEHSVGEHTYKIELEEGERAHVGLYFQLDVADGSLTISGPNGEACSANHMGDNEHCIFTAKHAGTYEIKVGMGDYLEGYDLEIRTGPRSIQAREPDSYYAAATPVVPGRHEGLEIRHAADRDFYMTFLEEGQTLNLTVSHAEGDGPFEVVTYTNEGDQTRTTTTEGRTISVTSHGSDRMDRFVGFYVRSANGSTGTYQFDVSVNGSFALGQWQDGWATTGRSSPISDGTYEHSLPKGPNPSTYSFRAKQGQNVSISITPTSGSVRTPWWVIGPEKRFIKNGDGKLSFSPPRDGIYSLAMYSQGGNVTYSLTIDGAVDWTAAEDSGSGGGSSGGMPGFGALAALVALLLGTAATRRVRR